MLLPSPTQATSSPPRRSASAPNRSRDGEQVGEDLAGCDASVSALITGTVGAAPPSPRASACSKVRIMSASR